MEPLLPLGRLKEGGGSSYILRRDSTKSVSDFVYSVGAKLSENHTFFCVRMVNPELVEVGRGGGRFLLVRLYTHCL